MVERTPQVFLIDGKRTPYGKFGGSLKDISPVDLACKAAAPILEQYKIKNISHVILGNVLPSTTDTLYGARHIGLKLGLDQSIPAYNVNRLCGSGIQSIWEARNQFLLGEGDFILAGGSENMSLAPHWVYGTRFGTKFGPFKTVDSLMDSLTDQYAGCPMAITAETLAKEYSITREQCDDFAFNSQKKAIKAWEDGFMAEEVVSIELKRGECSRDEHIRFDVDREGMSKLPPTFVKDGVVTAANASGIVDGASMALLSSAAGAEQLGVEPLAEIVDFAVCGVDPKRMGIGPVDAIKLLLEKQKMKIDQIDLFEINEAFAPQVLACAKALEIDQSKLNLWGGAVSIGHPLGASGTRITVTLARQMKAQGAKFGIASACIGGGQGIAVLLKR